MSTGNRREFLKAAAALAALPASIQKALAIPAASHHGTIKDVQHIVILMQENRSFDHYFGTMKGVRGFGDRHPAPLASGKTVWHQSDGDQEILPYHLDSKTTSAIRVPGTPHGFADSQAAWNQGKFGFWPKYKTKYAMGHYRREDIPFQFALADAFTICDAYHCSITTGTDPNRIVFWSGSNFNPDKQAQGENCTDADSEPNNLRCWIKGALPEPGYTYQGSAFKWPTLPDVLEKANISWRFYQDPNDNWTGAMHGGLAFESFREAEQGSAIYRKGMSLWSLEQFAEDVKNDKLPQVTWVLPPKEWSEHPSASSPIEGAEFTARVLNALTANPKVWSKTVFLLTFDENDGQFDHVPPPAVPSYNADGTLAGKSTLDLRGEYFHDIDGKYINPEDTISGKVRPWGLGPRVPLYIVSPWSKGGWVSSQVFDHTSVGQFLEKRFGVRIPAISPWHRAVCGDLTSAFDFKNPNNQKFPRLPDVSGSASIATEHSKKPKPDPPATPASLFQEAGVRNARPLPYRLEVQLKTTANSPLTLTFQNKGTQGVVFHVYDKLHLDRIPRRYTVEAGKELSDNWDVLQSDEGRYDLWVYGPNGFIREFRGDIRKSSNIATDVELRSGPSPDVLFSRIHNRSQSLQKVVVEHNEYKKGVVPTLTIPPEKFVISSIPIVQSGNWYDFTITIDGDSGYHRRFAGRLEDGKPGVSDPAMKAG